MEGLSDGFGALERKLSKESETDREHPKGCSRNGSKIIGETEGFGDGS
jgi:hypothetical protein